MNQPLVVTMGQPQGDLASNLASIGKGQRALAANELLQVGAIDVLHGKEMVIAKVAGIIRRDDIGVAKPPHGAKLMLKPVDTTCIASGWIEPIGFQHLDRNESVQLGMACAVYGPHPSSPDLVDDLVITNHKMGR